MNKNPKLLFFIAEDSTFYTHRLNLAKEALKAGYEVAIATRCKHYETIIADAGIHIFPLKKFRRGTIKPWQQLESLIEIHQIYKNFQPDIVHQVAMKPVVFGSIVARFNKIPKIINALGGLGYIFTQSNDTKLPKKIKKYLLRRAVLKFFHWIFSIPNARLILQNTDDIHTLVSSGCIEKDKIALIRGAGVDIQAYPAEAHLSQQSPIIISCISRLLWDKGIGELVDAAKIMQTADVPTKVVVYGDPDPENPTSIPLATLQAWHDAKFIEWRGHCNNVAKAYAECHIAVLPSYREGLPKTLLEAASSARPIVTTDVPGCREVVQDQENGLLVPAKNPVALAEALTVLCNDPALRERMGKAGRKRVEAHFSDSIIHQQTLALYGGL